MKFNDSSETYTAAMLKWVKDSVRVLPDRMANVVLYNVKGNLINMQS
jgi:hypothetical protein